MAKSQTEARGICYHEVVMKTARDQLKRLLLKGAVLGVILLGLLSGLCPGVASAYGWTGGHNLQGWSVPSNTVYFAEGTTRNGFEEYLILRNPGRLTDTVNIIYSFTDSDPRYQQLVLRGGAGAAILVNDYVGPDRDVSIQVLSENGIIAEREIYFNYKGVWTGGHATDGASAPSRNWYFAEGTTRGGFQEWLCLLNPNTGDVDVTVRYLMDNGENWAELISVPAQGRRTIDVCNRVGVGRDLSIVVEADSPVVAERPIYFDYNGKWRGGHTVTGATGLGVEFNFAEGTTRAGFEEYICILNPGEDAVATVEYMFVDGEVLTREYWLRGGSRSTITVANEVPSGRDLSIRVTCDRHVLCERPMYFNYHSAWEGGHNVIGFREGKTTWYFPYAASGPTSQAWLCIMNPSAETNNVLVQAFGDDDGYNEERLSMAALSRGTVDINRLTNGLVNPWIKVSGTASIIVERPVYFEYTPKVASRKAVIAEFGGTALYSPIPYKDMLGPVFHEASLGGGNNPQVMQPHGICLRNDNQRNLDPRVSLSIGSEVAYFIERTRGRGSRSTTACDIMAKAGTTAYAPVTGTVIAAGSYRLYGAYADLLVYIRPDSFPNGYYVSLLHMSSISVTTGMRVEAGVTPIGVVRDLTPYLGANPNTYTREAGNHIHMQVNYNAGAGSSGWDEIEELGVPID